MKADRFVWTLATAVAAAFIAGPSVAGQGLEKPGPALNTADAAPKVIIQAATTVGPADRVDGLHGELIDIMRHAGQLGFRGRYDRLAQVLPRIFNLPLMASVATGKYWTEFTTDQKRQVIAEFTKMTIATYAQRFDGYSGERFETLGTAEARKSTMLVKTQIVTGSGEVIPIDYLMHPTNGEWRVIDVFLKGAISELATKRSEYTSVLKRDGVQGLLDQLQERTRELQTQN